MREHGVPWRGAREKRPEFFIFFSALTDKDDIIMDWQCGVGWYFISLFFMFFLYLFHLPFIFLCSPSRISFFKEVLSLHANPFNAILWRLNQTSTSSSPSSSPCVSLSKNTFLIMLPHNKGRFFLLLHRRWRSTILICCVCKLLFGF